MPKLAVLASPSLMEYFMFSIACTVWSSCGQFSLGDLVFRQVLSPVFKFKFDYSHFGDDFFYKGLKYVFIKTTQSDIHKCIT
jgi:hypothetical protein